MLHATAMAIVIAYNMYLEVAEGKLDNDLRVEYPERIRRESVKKS